MTIRCLIASMLLFLVVSGCAIESRQLQALRQLFSESEVDLSLHLWELEFAGYSALVNAVVAEGKTFFVNESSDLVEFNGWVITQARGLRRFQKPWEIFDDGKDRYYRSAGQVKAVHVCEPWINEKDDKFTRFLQSCTGEQGYTNTILVDSLGRITGIKQVIDDSSNILSLRRREE